MDEGLGDLLSEEFYGASGEGEERTKMAYRSKMKSNLRKPSAGAGAAKCPVDREGPSKSMDWASLLGHRVKVCGKKVGLLRYYGRTHFAEGEWCGVVLDDGDGMNDGAVKGVRYFECPPGHGLFAPEAKVELVAEPASGDGDINATFVMKRLSGISSDDGCGPETSTPVVNGPKELNGTFTAAYSATPIRRLDETFDKMAANSTFVRDTANSTFVNVAGNSTFVKGMSARNATYNCDDENAGLDVAVEGDLEYEEEEEAVAVVKGRQGSLEMDDSLGILTPDQMRDFTLAMAGAVRTPSDEGIQELGYDLEEELTEDHSSAAAHVTVTLATGDMSMRTTDMLADGAMAVLMATPFSKSEATTDAAGISDITCPSMSDFDVTEMYESSDKMNTTVILNDRDALIHPNDSTREQSAHEGSRPLDLDLSLGKDQRPPNVIVDAKPLPEEDPAAALKRVIALAAEVTRPKEVTVTVHSAQKDRERPQSSLTVSATSIDTGYQGDAECDPQSEANSPVETEAKSFVPPEPAVTVAPAKPKGPKGVGDPSCSDSDFCSDMGASWTESEEDQVKAKPANARDVRIIDGHVYYVFEHHRVPVTALQGLPPKNGPGTTPPMTVRPQPEKTPSEMVQEPETPEKGNDTVVIMAEEVNNEEPVTVVVEEVPASPPKSEKSQRTPESPVTPGKVPEPSPKGKVSTVKKGVSVMSKIKAMVMGSGGSGKSASGGSPHDGGKSEKSRTPKKSRWDAVMSRIAAGQAEEKAKAKTGSRKEVKSKINTNRGMPSSDKENREPSRTASRADNIRKPSERKREAQPANKGSDTNEVSNRSSDRSASSRLPRPSTSSSGTRSHKLSSGLQRTTSQQSVASGRSQASTLSQLTLASHASNGKATQDKSTASVHASTSVPMPSKVEGPKKPTAAPRSAVHRTPLHPARPKQAATGSSCSAVTSKGPLPAFNPSSAAKRPVSAPGGPYPVPATGARPKTKSTIAVATATTAGPNRKGPGAENLAGRRAGQVKDTTSSRLKQVNSTTATHIQATKTVNDKEISRLEALCEVRTKEVSHYRIQMKHNALAAEAFSTIVSYLAHQMDAFEMPTRWRELRDAREVAVNLRNDLENEKTVSKSTMVKEREVEAELDEVRERNGEELRRLAGEHGRVLREMANSLARAESQFNTGIESLQQQHCKDLAELNKNHQRELEALGKGQCPACLKNAKEAESLQHVLEMKIQEIQELRRDTLDLKAKEDELDHVKERIKFLENKVEDLTAQLKASVEKERKLTWDIENVKETYEKENKVNKRLSMENESLQYKLQKCKNISPYLGAIEGSDSSGGKHPSYPSPGSMSVCFVDDGSLDGSGSPFECSSSPQRTPNSRPSSAVYLRTHSHSPAFPRPTSSPSQRASPAAARRPRGSKSISDNDEAAKGHAMSTSTISTSSMTCYDSVKLRNKRKETTMYYSFDVEGSDESGNGAKVEDEEEEEEEEEEAAMDSSGHSGADSILGMDLGSLDVDAARIELDEDFDSFDGRTAPAPLSVTPPPLSPGTSSSSSSGRKVIIRYVASHHEMTNGWSAGGPASESGDSRSAESSSSSSPRPDGPEDQPRPRSRVMDHLEECTGGGSSPRTSAGEAMMTTGALKVLDELAADEGNFRREDTPEESTSQAVAPTDSTNNDYSWSDDELLPSETEV